MNLFARLEGNKAWKTCWLWIDRGSSFLSMVGYVKTGGVALIIFLGLGWWSSHHHDVQVSARLTEIQSQMDQRSAENVLREYFYFIETKQLDKAWDLLSEQKRQSTPDGFSGFQTWLSNFVAFEGLSITDLTDKDSASTKVYLVTYNFKQRGMKPVETKMGFYIQFDGKQWSINYSNVLYENGWKTGACDFWQGFPICSH